MNPLILAAAFTLAVLPDTQNMIPNSQDTVMSSADQTQRDEFLERYALLRASTEWMAAQAPQRNLKVGVHVGDVIAGGSANIVSRITPGQWAAARALLDPLAAAFPWVISRGNHDDVVGWLANFGPGWHEAQVRPGVRWVGAAGPATSSLVPRAPDPTLGTTAVTDGDTLALAVRVHRDYELLVLTVSCRPSAAEVLWARQAIAAHAGPVVLVAHMVTFPGSSTDPRPGYHVLSGTTQPTCDDSQGPAFRVWDGLVVPQPQKVLAVVSGHFSGAFVGIVSVGAQGFPVLDLQLDYQWTADRGGNGWFALAQFDPDTGSVAVETLSPGLTGATPKNTLGQHRLTGTIPWTGRFKTSTAPATPAPELPPEPPTVLTP